MPNTDRELAIYISGPALELLKKLDYPGSTDVLASATSTEEASSSPAASMSLKAWPAGSRVKPTTRIGAHSARLSCSTKSVTSSSL